MILLLMHLAIIYSKNCTPSVYDVFTDDHTLNEFIKNITNSTDNNIRTDEEYIMTCNLSLNLDYKEYKIIDESYFDFDNLGLNSYFYSKQNSFDSRDDRYNLVDNYARIAVVYNMSSYRICEILNSFSIF